ncbi:MAG: aldo/keto reductase, partial [Actinomycetes bacterium]
WDILTPLEETLRAIEINYRLGKFRYFGISNYASWQAALIINECKNLNIPFITAQHEYSLVERNIEKDLIPLLINQEKSLLPWSPLGRGILTGKYKFGTPVDSRAASAHFSKFIQKHLTDEKSRIVDAVITAAEGIGRTPAEVSLAWLKAQPTVGSIILGARNLAQLKILLKADDLILPQEIINALSDVSSPIFSYPESRWVQLNKEKGN